MNTQVQTSKGQVDSFKPKVIILDAKDEFPKDVVFTTRRGEIKKYRIVLTRYDCLALNK